MKISLDTNVWIFGIVGVDNRDFLRGLAPGYSFKVLSPQEFCQQFDL
jgi:predicted nucleic acid-binding protein